MKCQYWWIDHMTKGNPVKHCENEDAKYLTCDFIDAIVCEKCKCRCYPNPLTEEQVKNISKRH